MIGANFLREFREFAARGNVLDLAVGVVIGTAFGKIVSSLVADIIMPPVGWMLGKVDFSDLSLVLSEAQGETPAVVVRYGHFLNQILDFLIVAFAIFVVIKQFNRLKRTPPPSDPATKDCPECATSIPIKAHRCPNCTSQLAAT